MTVPSNDLPGGFALRRLAPDEAGPFGHMTYPAYRNRLHRAGAGIALGAEIDGGPAGLALLAPPVDHGDAVLLSIFVEPALRRRGIAGALLAAAAEAARTEGASAISAGYPADLGSVEAIERLFSEGGWETPRATHWLAHAGAEVLDVPALDPGLLARLARHLPAHRLVLWDEVDTAAREALRLRLASGDVVVARDVDPFARSAAHEPMNSMALLVGDEIGGWLLTHRTGPLTVRYTTGWVLPPYDRTGAYALLVRAAIAAQVEAMDNHPEGLGTWSVPVEHDMMVRFLHRRLRPGLRRLCEQRGVRLALDRSEGPAPAGPQGNGDGGTGRAETAR